MKIKNGSSAIVFSVGVFVAAATVQASAHDAVLKAVANPKNTNLEAQNRAVTIHEETANISFDNTGVANSDSSLAEIDKNAIPNC